MNVVLRVFTVAVVLAVLAACGRGQPAVPFNANGKIRINIKKDAGKCVSRTVPKHHEVILADETELVWDIRDPNDCLAANDLVIKWTSTNASKCSEVTTKANGNKSQIKCDIEPNATPNTPHAYKLFLRDSANTDTLLEDPDVEIVVF
jgi:hypothetical protein